MFFLNYALLMVTPNRFYFVCSDVQDTFECLPEIAVRQRINEDVQTVTQCAQDCPDYLRDLDYVSGYWPATYYNKKTSEHVREPHNYEHSKKGHNRSRGSMFLDQFSSRTTGVAE